PRPGGRHHRQRGQVRRPRGGRGPDAHPRRANPAVRRNRLGSPRMNVGGEPGAEAAETDLVMADGGVCFVLDEDLYPLAAVYGTCYLFVDRGYVFRPRPGDRKIGVRLRAKEAAAEGQLEALAGEFANEALNQVLRLRVGESTARIREYFMARAFPADAARP